jgi:pimeloyl-ACP methyl ester carboxylesterase
MSQPLAPAETEPLPFRVHVPDATLERIRDRVQAYRWGALSEPADAEDWRYGPPLAFMKQLCRYWVDAYNWRAQEEAINRVAAFSVRVDDIDIHFIHERGSGPSPRPLLIAHGWPNSFNSYAQMVEQLAHPERFGGRIEDAFSVVVPSYPGYDFSSRPNDPMGPEAIGRLFGKLMERLGYDRYVVHGGDWGAHVASTLALHRPDNVAGIHMLGLAMRATGAQQLTGEVPADASDEEKTFIAAEAAIWRGEGAYAAIHATKPLKLAYAMADSPVGVAAWIVEAFHVWSDRQTRSFEEIFTPDQLITEVMLYLVTDAFPASTWIYNGKLGEPGTLPPGRRVEVPTGLTGLADPVFPMPPRAIAELSHNVVHYARFEQGGHFPFFEAPDILLSELRAFCRLIEI